MSETILYFQMEFYQFVVVGGGIAGVTCAESVGHEKEIQ